MIKFHHLALQGFRSFRADTVFTFPRRNGFYLLDGHNGAGKSSVWGGLCWVIYGKTDRGLKAGDVANWEREELTSGMLEFTVGGKLYALTRTWNPNSVNLDVNGNPRPVTQEQVDELIGLDYSGFLNTVLVSQFADTFFDVSATDRLDLFGQALDLGFWEEKGDYVRQKARGVSEALQADRNALERKRGHLQGLRETRRRLRGKIEEWQTTRDASLRELRGQFSRLRRMKGETERKMVKAKAREVKRAKAVVKLTNLVADAERAEREYAHEVVRLEGEITGALRDASKLEKESEAVKKLKGYCPTCKQYIKAEHVKDAAGRLRTEANLVSAECAHIRARLEKANRKARTAAKVLRTLREQLAHAKARVEAVRKRQSSILRNELGLTSDMEAIRHKIKALDEESPLEVEYERVRAEWLDTQKAVKGYEENVNKLEKREVALAQLAKLFKELRLHLIEEALAELEVECNNALVQLGLDGWAITFEVEKETKGGGVTRGFHVLITSPESKGATNWKAWSGGETQRLRIAGAVGLAAVIRSRRGLDFPLEIWDEPTTFIEESGIQDLLTYLQARSEDRQVWLIDHRSHTFGFDGHVTVKKDETGSKIIVRKTE
jgi:DNA repair exonuclease SbcCD ATPase subunit